MARIRTAQHRWWHIGATLAYVNGGNSGAVASAVVTSEAAAEYLTNKYRDNPLYQDASGVFQPNLLPEDVKAQIRDLTAGIGAVIGGAVRDSTYIDEVGQYRHGGVGVMSGDRVVHMAPPANQINCLMGDLLHWLAKGNEYPLIKSSIFHYEFEFIHPFGHYR